MTFKEQEQFTKKNSDDLLTELSNYQGENLISEIVRLGIQNLMELERDEHIGVGNYERGEDRRSQRNGYKSRQLYTRVGTLVLQVPQTRDGAFYPSILEVTELRGTVPEQSPRIKSDNQSFMVTTHPFPRTAERRVPTGWRQGDPFRG